MSPRYFFSGQSLLEVIVALAIFSLIAGAFVTLTLGSISSVNYGTDFLVADAFADQGVGEIRARRDNAWNDLTDGTEVETIDGRFERTITVSPVDLETKLLEVEVKWSSPVGQIQTVSRQTRLTNWDSRDWIQTDWSDGNGQISWFDPARYDSDDGKVDVTTIGEVKLKELPVAWSLFVDTDVQPWNDLWLLSPTDGFVVGNGGQIRRWNGSNWDTALASGTTQNLNAVHCSSATNCFAVGESGTIIRWNGTVWSVYSPSPTPQNLNALFLLSENSGWATGNSGVIIRFAGGGYETSGLLASSAFDVSDPSPVQIIGWDEIIPACSPACSIKFNIKTAATLAGLASIPWSPDFTLAAGTIINASYNGQRFVQYQVRLTGDGLSTPVLQEVRLNYK